MVAAAEVAVAPVPAFAPEVPAAEVPVAEMPAAEEPAAGLPESDVPVLAVPVSQEPADPTTVEPGAFVPVEVDLGADAPVQFADPVEALDEAGAEFAWSPWAQEMGLGEVEPAAAPSRTITQDAGTVEDNASDLDTEAFPVPQSPFADVVAGPETAAPVPDVPAALVPEPRFSAEVHPSQEAGAHVGAHAMEAPGVAADAVPSAAEQAAPAPGPGGEPDAAPDPLAGGLLAQLMSSVRGL
jgi:hypothetical protein